MTASADKVQFLLENCLQQTLPLVKKGIFSEQQLRHIMMQRQKHQNKLYSYTYKLSHYLKAIQFQYDLQRQRLHKIKTVQQDGNVNPLFKKQGKTDFAIIKRIIKLWDRTMNKYRYRTYLWKQYLTFCVIIKSKKHFYKALTNALRFLPFEVDLWKIGIRYEVEIGRNLWKARKLFHKGLKLVPAGQKNIELSKQLIKFQLEFVQTLQSRQKIIKGQNQEGTNDMKFIMGDNNADHQESIQQQQQIDTNKFFHQNQTSQLLKLRQYHQVLYVAIIQSIQKNIKSKTYFHNNLNISSIQRFTSIYSIYQKLLVDLVEKQQNQLLTHILGQTLEKLSVYKQTMQQKNESNELKIEVEEDVEDVVDDNVDDNDEMRDDKQQQQLQQQIEGSHQEQVQQQQQYKQMQVDVQQHPITKHQQALTKEQILSNEILHKYQSTKTLDQKLFTKAIKELCLKPIQLDRFLQNILRCFFYEALNILKSNQWLRLPANSMKNVLKKINQSISQQTNLLHYSSYFSKQFNKINPLEFITNIQLLKQVILFNKNINKIQENNKLYRSLLVNCKKNIQFVERAKSLFVE